MNEFGLVVLQRGKNGVSDRVQRAGYQVKRHAAGMLRSAEVRQLGRRIEFADDESADFLVELGQHSRHGKVGTETKEFFERGARKNEFRFPGRDNPDDDEGEYAGNDALEHRGPVAPPRVGSPDGEGHGCQRGTHGDEGWRLELTPRLIEGHVHADGGVQEHEQGRDPREVDEGRLVKEPGKPWSRQEEKRGEYKTHGHIEPEDGADVFIGAVLLAHQRRSEATLLQLPGDGEEDSSEAEDTHFCRADEACQNNAVQKLHRLHGAFLDKPPFDATGSFFLNTGHRYFLIEVLSQEIECAILLATAYGVYPFPINRRIQDLKNRVRLELDCQPVLQTKGTQQGIKAS